MFTISHIDCVNTDLTCNCLLAPASVYCRYHYPANTNNRKYEQSSHYNNNNNNGNNNNNNINNGNDTTENCFYAACYELSKSNAKTEDEIYNNNSSNEHHYRNKENVNCSNADDDDDEEEQEWNVESCECETTPMYRGSVTKYTFSTTSNNSKNKNQEEDICFSIDSKHEMTLPCTSASFTERHGGTFPGVFDLNYIPTNYIDCALPRQATEFTTSTLLTQKEEERKRYEYHISNKEHNIDTTENKPFALITSCTDGSVRILDSLALEQDQSLLPFTHETDYTTFQQTSCKKIVYPKLSSTMLTSCTPFMWPYNNNNKNSNNKKRKSSLHFLTTCHGGGVQVVNTHRTTVSPIQTYESRSRLNVMEEANSVSSVIKPQGVCYPLHPHEYDAWCSCVIKPQCQLDNHVLLCSGGDDGLLYLHDLRLCNNNNNNNSNNNDDYKSSVVAKAKFDAGVISLAPVIEQQPYLQLEQQQQEEELEEHHEWKQSMTTWNTPYLLAGCYDESLSLLDIRNFTQDKNRLHYTNNVYSSNINNSKSINVIARKSNLGGGVWRCNRTLYPVCHNADYNLKTITHSENAFSQCKNIVQEEEEEEEEEEEDIIHSDNENTRNKNTSYNNNNNNDKEKKNNWRMYDYMNAVNTNNILVLPLMQRGAALLPYNVKLSEHEIFAHDATYFPFDQVKQWRRHCHQRNTISQTQYNTPKGQTTQEEELYQQQQQEQEHSEQEEQECLVYDVAVLQTSASASTYNLESNDFMTTTTDATTTINSSSDRNSEYLLSTESETNSFVVATCSFYERAIDIWQIIYQKNKKFIFSKK